LILTGIELYTPWARIRPATLEVEGGRIRRVAEGIDRRGEDLGGAIVAPGLVDLHIHGYGGVDVGAGDPEALLSLAGILARHGITAFVPTAVAAPHEDLLRISRAVTEAMAAQGECPQGARILGLHLEGPYINPGKAGAQNPAFIRAPNWEEFRTYWDASGGNLRAVTVAPELPGALDFIARATGLGVTVSIGHTDATYEEAWAAIAAGARRATHLFNAMPPLHHRAPGAAAACLLAPGVTVELIADRVHVADPVLRLAWRLAGTGRTALVSDAIAAGGLTEGRYRLGGLEVEVRGGRGPAGRRHARRGHRHPGTGGAERRLGGDPPAGRVGHGVRGSGPGSGGLPEHPRARPSRRFPGPRSRPRRPARLHLRDPRRLRCD